MSFYNMINGYNPACVLLLPMLGRKIEEYTRFRDCFLTENNNIAVYTRAGGWNRNCGLKIWAVIRRPLHTFAKW